MATLIKSSGGKSEITPRNNKAFELEEAQALVGGYIQIIHVGDEKVMVFDEEGKLKGKPVNQMATIVAKMHRAIFPTDFIVGDVIYCKNDDI